MNKCILFGLVLVGGQLSVNKLIVSDQVVCKKTPAMKIIQAYSIALGMAS